MTTADVIAIEPLGAPPDAVVEIPGSKSLTNRALALAAIAEGTSTIDGVLLADDTEAMLGALRATGVAIELDTVSQRAVVHGCGGDPPTRDATIDARKSGTTARFLLPVLASFGGDYRIDGSEQLRARPMAELIDAVRSLGADAIEEGEPGHLPVLVRGPYTRDTVRVAGDVTSQFLSGLMLAGPLLDGGLTIECTTPLVSRPYVEMTAEVMRMFGAVVAVADRRIAVRRSRYRARTYVVEPDASSAAYFFAAAALLDGRVRIEGLSGRSLQGDIALIDVLARMGATVVDHGDAIEVRGNGQLHGVDIDMHDIPDMALTVAALAPFADGPTRVRGVGFIRGHESDRIAGVVSELGKLGITAEEEADGFVIHPGQPRPARIETHDDHRMAMSFALIGLRVPGVEISNPRCVDKTFPEFWEVLASLRAR